MDYREEHKIKVSRQRAICVFVDWLTTFVAFLLFNVFRFYYMHLGRDMDSLFSYLSLSKLILEQIFVPFILLIIYWLSGYYNAPFERSRLNEAIVTFYSQLFNAVVIYLAALTNDQMLLRRENWMLLLILFLLLFSFTYIGRLLVTARMMKSQKRLNIHPRTIIVGFNSEAGKLIDKINEPDNKIYADIIGVMPMGNEYSECISNEVFGEYPIVKNMEQLKELCASGNVEQVIIVPTPGTSSSKKILVFLYNLFPYNISIKIQPDTLSLIVPAIRLQDILGEPFVDLTRPQISEFSKNVKRTIDVLVATFGLILLSPLLGIVALGVKMSGKGPVFYIQERVGVHRKPFNIVKFRSMIPAAEEDGIPRLSSDTDERITPIGKWMRKYRIDELPQLWNVLKGDMALVGPRPEREYFINQIIRKAPWYTLVLQVRPGITSWGMTKFGYASDVDQMIERNRYDLIYIANMSIAVDFKILLHTIKTVGAGEGK